MEERDYKVIQKNYLRLVQTIEVENHSNYLYQEDVLSQRDKEIIYALSTSEQKAEKLLDILNKRKDGLKMLIKALLGCKVQAFLGNELLENVTWGEEEMEEFKLELEGKIDHQQKLEANMAALKQENNQLRARLEEKDEDIKRLTKELIEKDEMIKLLSEKREGKNSPRHATLTRTPAFKCNRKPKLQVTLSV